MVDFKHGKIWVTDRPPASEHHLEVHIEGLPAHVVGPEGPAEEVTR